MGICEEDVSRAAIVETLTTFNNELFGFVIFISTCITLSIVSVLSLSLYICLYDYFDDDCDLNSHFDYQCFIVIAFHISILLSLL